MKRHTSVNLSHTFNILFYFELNSIKFSSELVFTVTAFIGNQFRYNVVLLVKILVDAFLY